MAQPKLPPTSSTSLQGADSHEPDGEGASAKALDRAADPGRLLHDLTQVVELMATGSPLDRTLVTLASLVEAQSAGGCCAVLLTRPDGRNLEFHAASGRFPQDWVQLLAGTGAGVQGRECGATDDGPIDPLLRQLIGRGCDRFTADIASDPLWEPYREYALPLGLRACWLKPILGPAREVLGALALCHRTPRALQPADRQRLGLFAHLAALALERAQAARERARLLTERQTVEQQLAFLTDNDPLTGVPNRASFMAYLEEAFARARRSNAAIGALVIDLDDFKAINDTMGHSAGDQVLVAAARRLLNSVRVGDGVGRMGGDEFVVVLEGVASRRQLAETAERIVAAMQAPVRIDGAEAVVSASVGAAISTGRHTDPSEVLRDASLALFAAKSKGKCTYALYDGTVQARPRQRPQLISALRRALDRNEFVVYYQPLVDLRAGQVVSLEALVRWNRPGYGLVLPGEFIPVAEESGLVVPITHWVLEEAARQVRNWQVKYPARLPLGLSVNLSPRHLQRAGMVDEVVRVLAQSGLEPGSLCLEITENGFLEDMTFALQVLNRLKGVGVRLALDDFGTGYSSLSYLRRLPLHILKIDRSFVAGLGTTPTDAALVQAMISLAHTLGLQVVAEGVETQSQLPPLRELGCDFGQGYSFGKPMPAAEVEALLARG